MTNPRDFAKAASISLPLIFSGVVSSHAQGMIVIDNQNNIATTEAYLGRDCKSYMAKDVERCVNTHLSLTKGLAESFITYIGQNNLGRSYQRAVATHCVDGIDAVVQRTPPALIAENPPQYLPRFVQDGFLSARTCLETVESIGNMIGVDYNPSSRARLHNIIDNAEQGSLPFRFRI